MTRVSTKSRSGHRTILLLVLAAVVAVPCTVVLIAISVWPHDGYQQVDGKWAYVTLNSFDGPRVKVLDGEPKVVELLADPDYAVGNGKVFACGYVISDADPASFALLSSPYSQDSNKVYCGNLPLDDADPEHFRVLYEYRMFPISNSVEGLFGKDVRGEEGTCVAGPGWGADTKNVYFGPVVVPGANPESFELLNKDYGIDDSKVFYRVWEVLGADRDTFVATGTGVKDKNRRYGFGKALVNRGTEDAPEAMP